jgi:pSer/pThr/pTyr-binding forkhead associated (FHA) protein
MQTQYIRDASTATPWLERFSEEDGNPERTYLENFPFSIGRNESADLQIESSRVSREHAVITEKSRGVYCIKDLKSTNGTFVNGQRIQEIELQDGDLVAVANFELIFSNNCGRTQSYAQTQMMTEGFFDVPPVRRNAELLQNLRLGGEMLLEGVSTVRFEPIFDLGNVGIQGYEGVVSPAERRPRGPGAGNMFLNLDCRLTLQLRHVERLLAVEEAIQLPQDGPILFRLTAAETAAESFSDVISTLEHLTGDTHKIALAFPHAAAAADSEFAKKIRLAGDAGIRLAVYDYPLAGSAGFFGKDGSLLWLILESGVLRSLKENPQRQLELRSLGAACRETGSELVAAGVRTAAEAELCRNCGCRLGQGSWRSNVIS